MFEPKYLAACLLLGAMLPLGAVSPLEAQARGGESAYESRADLRQQEEDLQERIARIEDDSDFRKRLQQDLARVRRRLREGDFRPGDAVQIRVPGSDTLSGVFQVETDGRLRVPVIGDVDLSGVLYAEADSVLREELSRYVRSDRIEVRPLKRVAVLGAVGDPGYYDVAPSITISDLLMRAGGPTQESDLDELSIQRDGQQVASVAGGLRESATLAELGVERGDQVRVPATGGGSSLGVVLSVIGGVTSVAWAVSRIF